MGELSKVLNIKKEDKINIIGAGGKTKLMYKLASELKVPGVILTSNVSMNYPEFEEINRFLDLNTEDPLKDERLQVLMKMSTEKTRKSKIITMENLGIIQIGRGVDSLGVIKKLSKKDVEAISPYFRYVINKGDCSNGKLLKGFRSYEPIVPETTTVNIGVLDIKSLGFTISDKTIFNLSEFLDITNSCEGTDIDFDHLVKIIISKCGLFKNSRGRRILFLNNVWGKEDHKNAIKLKELLQQTEFKSCTIIGGDFNSNKYFIV